MEKKMGEGGLPKHYFWLKSYLKSERIHQERQLLSLISVNTYQGLWTRISHKSDQKTYKNTALIGSLEFKVISGRNIKTESISNINIIHI